LGGGCRRAVDGLVERRGGRAVVDFDFSGSALADSLVSEVFSAAFSGDGDGLASAVSVTSGGGLGSVAPTDDKRFLLAFSAGVSVDSVISATGMPPTEWPKVPPKRM
jgi:hypothetical protein